MFLFTTHIHGLPLGEVEMSDGESSIEGFAFFSFFSLTDIILYVL